MVKLAKILTLLVLCSIFTSYAAFAQNNEYDNNARAYDNYDLEYRKWRVTLFPPLSTNGLDAINYSARYSINLVAGYHGGLEGGEIGALFNYNKHYTYGFQIGGLANISGGDMIGLNFAGLFNYANNDLTGIQAAGLFNYGKNSLTGIQAAAITNFSKGDITGIQAAGLANISDDSMSGIQIAGLMNSTSDEMSGIQLAGIINYSDEEMSGVQLSSLFNASKDEMSGLQLSGISNFTDDDMSGLQGAGVLNYASGSMSGLLFSGLGNYSNEEMSGLLLSSGFNITKNDASGILAAGVLNYADELVGISASGGVNIAREMTGIQFAGLLNYSKQATGIQVGLINIGKEFEGVPVGLISYYTSGRKNIDIRYSDAGFTELGINLGTHRIYNMAILGYNTHLNRDVYRVGVAVGLEKRIQDSFEKLTDETLYVNQELSYVHHFEGEYNSLTNGIWSYKFLVGKRFADGFSVYAGPTFNGQVTRLNEASDYTWYSLWSPEWKGRQYRFWVGFNIGVRLFSQPSLPAISDYGQNWEIDW